MASLCRPLRQLSLLQTQLPLSPCLAYQICRPLQQQRLLHSTPIFSARKPSRAVLKPTTDALKTRRKPKQDVEAAREQDKATALAAQEQQRLAAVRLQEEQKVKAAAAAVEAIGPVRDMPVSLSPTSAAPRALPPAPRRQKNWEFQSRPNSAHAMLRELADAPSPTLLYEATKPGSYVLTCLAATLGLGLLANVLFSFYLSDLSHGNHNSALVVLFTGIIWTSVALYTAWGPVGLIRRIYALPTAHATKKIPTLRVEPFQFIPGYYPKPFQVPVGGAYRDRPLNEAISKFAAAKPHRRTPGVMDGFFSKVETIFTANSKMCTRASSFARIRVPGTFFVGRLDLRDCKALGDGQALDNLVLTDVIESSLLTKMFKRD